MGCELEKELRTGRKLKRLDHYPLLMEWEWESMSRKKGEEKQFGWPWNIAQDSTASSMKNGGPPQPPVVSQSLRVFRDSAHEKLTIDIDSDSDDQAVVQPTVVPSDRLFSHARLAKLKEESQEARETDDMRHAHVHSIAWHLFEARCASIARMAM